MKKRTQIIIALFLVLVVCGIAGLKHLDYWITSQIYPDIWNKSDILGNYRLHEGHLIFSFPESVRVLNGYGSDISGTEIQNVVIQGNKVGFFEVDYGKKNKFEITVLNGAATNWIECFHYHSPNWSRNKIEVHSLEPLEYKLYGNGELLDIEEVWTTITNRTNQVS